MKSIRIMLPLLLLLAAVTVAQGGLPPVAEEMKKFEPMLGNWESSGTVHMAADQPAMPWTSRSTCKKILGGHAVLEDMTIALGPDMPPLVFRNIYTWDKVTERYMALKSGNNGQWSIAPMFWTADNKIVDASTKIRQGKVVAERWVIEFGEGTMSFRGWESIEGGEPFLHVEGKAKRGGDGYTVTAASAKHVVAPPSDKLKALSVMFGDWDYSGEMEMVPGAPKMKISGTEKIYNTLGGHVICMEITGNATKEFPMEYRGLAFMAWDPAEKCISNVGFSNIGELHTQKMYPGKNDRRFLMFGTGIQMGTPMTSAGVMEWSKDGSTMEAWSHVLVNGEPSRRSFEGKFSRRQADAAEPKKL